MKKTHILILAGLLALGAAAAYAVGGRQPVAVGAATLHVTLGGVAGQKGALMGAICNRESFLKQCQYFAVQQAGAPHELNFTGIAPGSYAVMVYHDENNNGKLDKAASGMPLEGYGFSRNARGHWGPPNFDDARFDIKPGANAIALDMVY
ncbi:DUF2141 domain-containing protein [Pseudoduganella violaceinigra]|uniref:DUF2141 domain-containing protein n=1 Tax=Pseudoduganella violaceinigra TaxID=246602 RepID=UPI000429FCC0|nr:DUF2141 domain-containing protein [Pseudoduganella violaceinigra]